MKVVLRGELIAITSRQKKLKQISYLKLVGKLKKLEIRSQTTQNNQILQEIKNTKGEIDTILKEEIEKKLRFVKQDYYEMGSKATKLLARRIRKQQATNTIHKIRDHHSGQLKYNAEEIENTFKDCYKTLYTQQPSSSDDAKRRFLNSLDLPSIGVVQNNSLVTPITPDEVSKAISRLKANKSPGADGFPSQWYCSDFRGRRPPTTGSLLTHFICLALGLLSMK